MILKILCTQGFQKKYHLRKLLQSLEKILIGKRTIQASTETLTTYNLRII